MKIEGLSRYVKSFAATSACTQKARVQVARSSHSHKSLKTSKLNFSENLASSTRLLFSYVEENRKTTLSYRSRCRLQTLQNSKAPDFVVYWTRMPFG